MKIVGATGLVISVTIFYLATKIVGITDLGGCGRLSGRGKLVGVRVGVAIYGRQSGRGKLCGC